MKKHYGVLSDGREVSSYVLKNSKGLVAEVLDYGAILDKLYVPDSKGNVVDVVLTSGCLEEYIPETNFLGATVGPIANRTAGAELPIDGKIYKLDKNDGENNLHTNIPDGLNKRMWNAVEGDNSVTFSITLSDGEYGLPGERYIEVTYSVTEDNGIQIDYYAKSDKNTVINLTNHTHFNLAGHNKGFAMNHVLKLNASKYTPIVAGAIPTGEITSVIGTELDFTEPKAIIKDLYSVNEQMKLVNGYDFNYVIDDYDGSLREVAILTEPESGRVMKVITDQPGIQLYTDNWVINAPGKDGVLYNQRGGICLETQVYPDSVHHDNFPDVVYGPGRDYKTTTIYRFE